MGSPENFSGGCGHGWNTFDTRGACPGCSYQWKHTWCLDCGKPSLHDDWYVSGGGQP
jgi:predicted amidophosphoribosyltransferase